MRILLLGAHGQLGRALFSALCRDYPDWQVVALGKVECDITDPDMLVGALDRHQPDVILNGAAFTAVDLAESQSERAYRINHQAVALLAREANTRGILLVHFSTDYVFDGSGCDPWREVDVPFPLNVYGASKLAGEQAIQALCPGHLIVRTSWLYGGEGTHFARTILRRAKEGKPLEVVGDQWGTPTQVDWLATSVLLALTQVVKAPDMGGLYHLCPSDETSWHGFASALVKEGCRLGLLARPVPIKPIPSESWPQAARRPLNSRLDCRRFSAVFGVRLPPWQQQMRHWLAGLGTVD
ncbi:TPA: dTDP-4-dehydrorhamnose reductase [Aeromonas salmonicida subsp. pectinolytica]|uniref:dTDP-4-dehydrorhamnose reductase n=1 Tax=Aeromonas salmonicida TaxID=645 RepID=UPI00285F3A8A|nr:dTDP-4-dehydrorhamnose reductase [Aeromonas salmonicida]MDR6994386.1 dTDP-4-dehydrorhamnose reductase [Aeromonas salmonicida]